MNRPIFTSPGRTIDKPDIIFNAKKEFYDLIPEENTCPRNCLNILFPEALFIRDLVRILLEIAERKNRYLLETIIAMMFGMNVPRLGRSCVDRNILDQSHTV